MTESTTSVIADLKPDESELRGSWVRAGHRTVADAVSQRIVWLRNERLQRLAIDNSGWNTLYRDPRDGRLWELIYEIRAGMAVDLQLYGSSTRPPLEPSTNCTNGTVVTHMVRPNSKLKLAAPGFGPGLKPLGQIQA